MLQHRIINGKTIIFNISTWCLFFLILRIKPISDIQNDS